MVSLKQKYGIYKRHRNGLYRHKYCYHFRTKREPYKTHFNDEFYFESVHIPKAFVLFYNWHN